MGLTKALYMPTEVSGLRPSLWNPVWRIALALNSAFSSTFTRCFPHSEVNLLREKITPRYFVSLTSSRICPVSLNDSPF